MFHLALLLRRFMTILGTQVCQLITFVREANENAGNPIAIVQFLMIRIILLC